MPICLLYSIFLFFSINCAENTFKIDFSFLFPDYYTTHLIDMNSNETTQNITYYQGIKPMTHLCIGDPFQCFQILLSFNISETIINLNSVNFDYENSFSFFFLQNINMTKNASCVSDTIKLSKRTQNKISEFHFILKNESEPLILNSSIIGLGRNRLFDNDLNEKDISFSLIRQLRDLKMIETSEITIKYKDSFSGKITIGTNYTGMNLDEKSYLELPDTENSLNGYLQSIYIEDSTISSTRKKHIDILEKDKRKRIVIDFESPFITFGEEIFEQLKTISFNPLINAGICQLRKDDNLQIQYLLCNKNDILISNLDRLIFIINNKKNFAINLNELFLPYQDGNDKMNNIFGIVSGNNNETINIGTVLLKKYMICINKEKNSIRLYLKNISNKIPTDFFGIAGIIALTTIICTLIVYMVATICGKDKYEPKYSPKTQKFLRKANKSLDSSILSNESF